MGRGARAGWLSRMRSRTNPFASRLEKTVTVVIDDQLVNEVLRATGRKTKREAVELGLRTLLCIKQQEEIRRSRGKLERQADLEDTKTDR